MIKDTRFFFFDVDTSNCKAMISMIKATRFFFKVKKNEDKTNNKKSNDRCPIIPGKNKI